MSEESLLSKETMTAIAENDYKAFEELVWPLIDFEHADENTAPHSDNAELNKLLETFCNADAYEVNHLDILESPDPHYLCKWVDETQDPSPCPDYKDWGWTHVSGVRESYRLSNRDKDYYGHSFLIEKLYNHYGDKCIKAQRKEWLKAFFYELRAIYKKATE